MKKEEIEKKEGEVSENVNNVNTSINDSVQNDSNIHDDYVKLYEQCNSINEHQFASHATSGYNPLHRYSTLTFMCQIIAENNLRMNVRCMLDNCSDLSILKRSVADKLFMSGENCELTLSVTGESRVVFKKQKRVKFRLANLDGSYITDFVVEASTAPKISSSFEKININPKDFEYLSDLEFTEELPMTQQYFEDNNEIQLMLGLPFQFYIRKYPYYIFGPLGQPAAVLTYLGNCVSFNRANEESNKNYSYLCRNCEKDIPFLEDWLRLDSLGIEDPTLNNHLTYDELRCDEILDRNTVYLEKSNQYITVLPWKNEPIKYNNRDRALAAASRFAKKYMNNKVKWDQMIERIQFMLKNKFIEIVPKRDMEKTTDFHYLVAMPVWREDSSTHKCRIVFQANQKMPDGKSLNSHFLTGKNNLPLIPTLLMRFRTHIFAGVTDVSSMFNRFLLQESDTEYLRFVFAMKKPNSKEDKVELINFRNRCLPFGISPSPSIATYLLKKHATKFLNTPLHLAARFVMESTYMDDCSWGANTLEEMKQLVKDIKYIFDQCSLPTHKYFSNSEEALENLEQEFCSNAADNSVLGTLWSKTDDTLSFNSFRPPKHLQELEEDEEQENITEKSNEEIDNTYYTKRMLASISAKVYDVSGFICPFVLTAKKLLQQTWIKKLDWDDILPEEILIPVREFVKELPKLKDVKIPRKIVPVNGEIVELCIFSDACATSYGTTVYAVSQDDQGNRFSNLVFAKSKVKPLNKNLSELSEDLSIPRMELLGCYVGSIAGKFCLEAFKDKYPKIRMRYFTDSLITLYRIHNDASQYKPWVAHRLIHIQKSTNISDWFFVSGELNFSGDVASRGAMLSEFIHDKRWLEGPGFILDPNHKYVTVADLKLSQAQKQSDSAEKKKILPTFHHTFVSHHLKLVDENQLGLEAKILASDKKQLDFFEANDKSDQKNIGLLYRKSSWQKIVRILAWIVRYVNRLRNRVQTRKKLQELKVKSENYKFKLRKRTIKEPKLSKKEPEDSKKVSVKMPPLKKILEKDINYEILKVSASESILSQLFLFRYCQFTRFSKQISCIRNGKELDKSDELHDLLPIWSDEEKILRSWVRDWGANLIILPKNHRVTELFIMHTHVTHNHSSVPHTMTLLNEEVHIPKCRQQIKKVLKCCSCRSPIQLHQRISKLPQINYKDPSKIGHFLQIDLCGPFMIKNEAGELVKTWCCVFLCLVSRHVTLKLLRSCSTKDLILGIRSYVAQRGKWQIAYSDSATYFHAGSRELKSIMSNIKWNQVLDEVLSLHMEWKFNVPFSPHRTGGVEALIKLIKRGLYKAIKNETLDFLQLSVVFEEISSILNSRPLGYVVSSDKSSEKELMVTPSILCYGRNSDVLPIPVKFEDIPTLQNTSLQKIYYHHRLQVSAFWKNYIDHYCNLLKFPKKWVKNLNFKIEPNTFILIKEPNLKKFQYKTGRVLSTIRSKDGLIRTLEIQTTQNKKPIFRDIKLCSLLEHTYLKLAEDNHECFFTHKSCLLSNE